MYLMHGSWQHALDYKVQVSIATVLLARAERQSLFWGHVYGVRGEAAGDAQQGSSLWSRALQSVSVNRLHSTRQQCDI